MILGNFQVFRLVIFQENKLLALKLLLGSDVSDDQLKIQLKHILSFHLGLLVFFSFSERNLQNPQAMLFFITF